MTDIDLASLGTWMASAAPGLGRPLSLDKFAGGQSNPTYRITAEHGRAVLRRKPFGTLLPSAHAVEREYRVISALDPLGFPVPPPIALCEDAGVIGAPFYLMGLADGRNITDGTMPGIAAAERTRLYEAMIDTLVTLHSVDPQAAGLGDYGRPGNYFARQVDRWTRQYRAAQTDDLPDMERLIEWLPGSVPEQSRTTIIHGDYRIDNLIFAANEPRVIAVIDWELSTLGDPLSDFAYLLMNWLLPADGRAGLGGADLAALGIPSLDDAVARYCAGVGRDGIPDLPWLFAFNLFRIAGILQGVKKRIVDGNASSADAASMAAKVPLLARAGWDQARIGGAREAA